jgi:hypothetical protein
MYRICLLKMFLTTFLKLHVLEIKLCFASAVVIRLITRRIRRNFFKFFGFIDNKTDLKPVLELRQ